VPKLISFLLLGSFYPRAAVALGFLVADLRS
jgi:hypothetical protein